MFLSIVIPHYNLPQEMLERCLRSILALGIPDNEYEIIVVDDGSDKLPTWVLSLSNRITLTRTPHRGPGGARNQGIREAQGEYVMFADADDYLLNNGQITECLAKLKTERPHILRYRYIVREEGQPIYTPKRRRVRFGNTISGAAFVERNNLSGSSWTFFFQRELATRKGIEFPEDIFHEDEEFNTIIHYHAQTLVESNAVLYCYSIRNGSTTSNCSKEFEQKRIGNLLKIIERLSHFSDENSASCNTVQRRAITHKLDMLAVDAILNMMYAGMGAREITGTCRESLSPLSLYPLRKASYSIKYFIFRLLANNKAGMLLLRLILPKHKPAKR